MSNMSYCRYRNTASDLRDCLRAERDNQYGTKPCQEDWKRDNPPPQESDFETEAAYERADERWDEESESLLSRDEHRARKDIIDTMAKYLEELGFTVTGHGYQDHHDKASDYIK